MKEQISVMRPILELLQKLCFCEKCSCSQQLPWSEWMDSVLQENLYCAQGVLDQVQSCWFSVMKLAMEKQRNMKQQRLTFPKENLDLGNKVISY